MFKSPPGICKLAPFWRRLDKPGLGHENTAPSSLGSPWRILPALALLTALSAMAPSQSISNPTLESNRPGHHTSPADPTSGGQEAMQQHKLLAQLNAERQKSMVSDAAKLLRLAQELHTELSRPDSGLSSSQEAHKVAEIEKLAHSVREKMTFAIGTNLSTDSPFTASTP